MIANMSIIRPGGGGRPAKSGVTAGAEVVAEDGEVVEPAGVEGGAHVRARVGAAGAAGVQSMAQGFVPAPKPPKKGGAEVVVGVAIIVAAKVVGAAPKPPKWTGAEDAAFEDSCDARARVGTAGDSGIQSIIEAFVAAPKPPNRLGVAAVLRVVVIGVAVATGDDELAEEHG
ncbi:hypothetical protein DFQ27_000817 [Actinomortierella ambigua]|uniref:Uncharacterized protein n=1 Tax=Actinomortierella ambigua TaxID=1343610 RepID=A0A9P6U9K7_9FUNG|nr:hypothetical protein DFQ27_000817 [Actinomortierella ambigua]